MIVINNLSEFQNFEYYIYLEFKCLRLDSKRLRLVKDLFFPISRIVIGTHFNLHVSSIIVRQAILSMFFGRLLVSFKTVMSQVLLMICFQFSKKSKCHMPAWWR